MTEQDKLLNDELLKDVSGGAETGTYIFNGDGSVTFTDKNGQTCIFTGQQWQALRNRWSYTTNPEYWISTVPLSDLQMVLRNPNI